MSSLLKLVGASAALILTVQTQTAQADGFSIAVGGSIDLGASVHVNIAPLVEVVEVLANIDVGVAIYSEPPPPPVVVAVYSERPPPPPPPIYYVEEAVVPAPRPQMRRWAMGAFAGTVDVDGQEVGSDIGLLARYRATRGLSVEVEAAQSKLANGGRLDRRLGASLLYDLAPSRRLSPSLLVGGGYGQTEIGDGEFHAQQAFAEVGVGLTFRATKSLQVIADARFGARDSSEEVSYKLVGPEPSYNEDEHYSRARLGLLLFF